MQHCKSIGCPFSARQDQDFCMRCLEALDNRVSAMGREEDPRRQEAPSGRSVTPTGADEILERAHGHMQDRASTYDSPDGERSVGKTVAAFNALTGHRLSETEGWYFMSLLKIARATQGDYKADNHEDHTAYAALAGEAAAREAQEA